MLREIHYTDGEKNYPIGEIDQMWKMESLVLEFDCPICEYNIETTKDAPLSRQTSHTCSNCINEYSLFPRNNPNRRNIKEMDDQEKVELQLKSLKEIHPIVEKYPALTANVSHNLESVIFGGTAVVVGTLITPAVGLLASDLEIIPTHIGISIIAIAVTLGWFTLLKYLGALYFNLLIKRRNKPEMSYYTYINYIGNHFQTKPFNMFD